jgi:predicted PurR-regulated permease PerM
MPEPIIQVRVANFRSLIFWALGIFLLVRFIDTIAVTLIPFILVLFFTMVLDPPIRRLERRGLSRSASVLLLVLFLVFAAYLVISYAIPPIIKQANDLAVKFPDYTQRLEMRFEELTERYPHLREQIARAEIQKNLSDAVTGLGRNLLPQIGRFSLSFLTGLLSLLLVMILTLYTVANPKPLVRGFVHAFPPPHRRTVLRVLFRVSQQLQLWVRATFLLMLSIGIPTTIFLWLIGVKSPLLFGALAGLGEGIPTIGPILTAIPPILVAFADDPIKALYVLVFFIALQQIENNFLVPRIMSSALRLHFFSVMFSVVVMGSLIGPIGILLATPTCAFIKVLYEEVYQPQIRRRREKEQRRAEAEKQETEAETAPSP